MLTRVATILVAILVAGACAAPIVPPTNSPPPTASLAPAATPTAAPSAPPTAGRPPTASPQPSPTFGATATPSTGITVSEQEIERHLAEMQRIADANGGLRAAGLSGYDASADYVAAELERLGYSVTRQPFDFWFFDEAAPVELSVGGDSWSGADWLHAMIHSAPGDIAGPLEQVSMDGEFAFGTGGCVPEDWAGFTPGSIALVGSGPCFRRDQVLNAQDAGAIGLISLYPRWELGQTRRPVLLDPNGITIPAIAAGQEPAAALLAAAAAGGTAQLSVAVTLEERPTTNVIAELAGRGDGVVMLGGHLDSVLDGPGLNDNGSGVATLIALAAALRDQPQPEQTIRFGFWAAEEFGDLGSQVYVNGLPADEVERIGAYFNLDMVGSTNAVNFVYDNELSPAGSDELTTALVESFTALGAQTELFDAGPASDHFAFELAGIPIGGVFSGLAPLTDDQAQRFGGVAGEPADPCYHLACDGRTNVDTATARLFGQAVGTVVENIAY